jgi:hypothetical protein
MLGPAGRAPEHPGWDIFEAVLPEAKRRGLQSFAWIEESSYAAELRRYPSFPKCLEVDAWGRPVPLFCFNNPDYRDWHLSIVEDYVKNYDLDGLAWCSERPGPLNLLVQAPVVASEPRTQVTCFCQYCQALASLRQPPQVPLQVQRRSSHAGVADRRPVVVAPPTAAVEPPVVVTRQVRRQAAALDLRANASAQGRVKPRPQQPQQHPWPRKSTATKRVSGARRSASAVKV